MTVRSLVVVCVSAVWFACGPDAQVVVDGADVDGDELASSESELTSSSRSGVWFPLNTGNTWTYESSTGASRTFSLSSVSADMALVSGMASPTWVGVSDSSSNTLARWDASKRTWVNWLRFGYASSTWSIGTGECSLRLRRSATGATVISPAGSFADTRTIAVTQVPSVRGLCAPPEFTELTFAAGVGLVAFRTGYGDRFTLKSAVVDSKRWPSSSAVTATLTLDKASYVNKPNTIRCITTPCPGNDVTAVATATFRVVNNTSSTRTWQFRSGCQLDIDVVASNGVTVKRLSDGRFCTTALSSVTLAPGQSRTWTAELPLSDRDGLQLDGTYSARARLIPSTTTPPAPAASTSFSVRIVE